MAQDFGRSICFLSLWLHFEESVCEYLCVSVCEYVYE